MRENERPRERNERNEREARENERAREKWREKRERKKFVGLYVERACLLRCLYVELQQINFSFFLFISNEHS